DPTTDAARIRVISLSHAAGRDPASHASKSSTPRAAIARSGWSSLHFPRVLPTSSSRITCATSGAPRPRDTIRGHVQAPPKAPPPHQHPPTTPSPHDRQGARSHRAPTYNQAPATRRGSDQSAHTQTDSILAEDGKGSRQRGHYARSFCRRLLGGHT